MTAGAGGTERPPEGSARPPESAAFAPARLGGGGRRIRPPVLASAFVLILGIVVAAGVSGRLGAGAFPAGGENQALAASPDATDAATEAVAPTPLVLPEFPADTGPIYTSAPGAMQVQAKRHPATIFVHGDIDAQRITWVFVSVLDDVGRVAGWTSVSVPGAAGPNASGPTIRFDTELAIPADFDGRLWVRAQAYDTEGKVVAATSVEIPAPPS